MPSFTPDPAGLKFGPLWFRPGLSGKNIATVNFAAFSAIAVITFMGFAQPYILNEILHVPFERQGTFTGNLAAIQEIVAIFFMGIFGALSDRIGRRRVFTLGFILLALGYFVYPLARTEAELMLYRAFFAIGSCCVPIMLSVTIHDSCQEVSRGKWVATNSIFTGFGVLAMALVLSKTPSWYISLGADPVAAGRYAYWTTAAFCVFAGIFIWFGMRDWVKPAIQQSAIFTQIVGGIKAAVENPRLGVAYASGFIGRGDLVVIATFLSLWVVQYGVEHGLSTGQSLGRAGMLFGIVQGAAMLWSYFMGMISDRLNRMTSLGIALALAAVGYSCIGLIENPLGRDMIPAAIMLGIGEVSVLIASGAAMGQEAPAHKRGAIVGVFGLMGGAGILFSVYVGGLVFDNIGRTAPFVMMGILNFALMLVAFVFSRRPD
jgi:MFS family permease